MISPSSLSAFSVSASVAPPASAAARVQPQAVQLARGQPAAQGPATSTQQLQANPPAHPGHAVPRGSLLDLKV